MTEQAKLALINWTGLVTAAIARQCHEKYVDWREIVDAQNTLQDALQTENLRFLYNELIYSVSSKHYGETRHETALRYIREREMASNPENIGTPSNNPCST